MGRVLWIFTFGEDMLLAREVFFCTALLVSYSQSHIFRPFMINKLLFLFYFLVFVGFFGGGGVWWCWHLNSGFESTNCGFEGCSSWNLNKNWCRLTIASYSVTPPFSSWMFVVIAEYCTLLRYYDLGIFVGEKTIYSWMSKISVIFWVTCRDLPLYFFFVVLGNNLGVICQRAGMKSIHNNSIICQSTTAKSNGVWWHSSFAV